MSKYCISFRRDMLDALEKGKRVTRRMNTNWLKVKEGDVLLAREGRCGKTEYWLIATKDAYRQPLWEMTHNDILKEGIPPQNPGAYDPHTFDCLWRKTKDAWIALWDEINGDKPGMAWIDNPSPVVIEFAVESRRDEGAETL